MAEDKKAVQEAEGQGEGKVAEPAGYVLSAEEEKQRKRRNAAIALGIAGFIVLIFLVTIFRIGGDIANRSF